MDCSTERTRAQSKGINLFGGVVGRGKEKTRLVVQGVSKLHAAAVRTSAPVFAPWRYKKIGNVWININSAKKRLGLKESELNKANLDSRIGLLHKIFNTEEKIEQSELSGLVSKGVGGWVGNHLIDWSSGELNIYTRSSAIGEGGYGTVWNGIDRIAGESCAIKLPKPDDRETVEALEDERRAYQEFGDETVRYVAHAQALVMPLFDGDLSLRKGAKFTPKEKREIIKQICDQVAAWHEKGIVLRDIKPANILFRRTDGGIVVKIVDPASAMWKGNVSSELAGTPAFLKADDVKKFMTGGDRLELARGMDIHALVISLLRFGSGKKGEGQVDFVGEAMRMIPKGNSPCTEEEFYAGLGGKDAESTKMWTELNGLLDKLLKERSAIGLARNLANSLSTS